METSSSRSFSPGAIMGLIGGALLVVGSLMTWATVSANIANIAAAFGVDPSTIPTGTFPGAQSIAGSSTNRGKTVIVCGVIAIVAALLVIMVIARTVAAAFLMLAGLVGGGFALYTGLNGKDDAISEGAKQLSSLGLPGDVKSFFNVSIGIGVWVCVVGGLIAIVGGVMALRGKPAAAAAGMSSGDSMGTGMGTAMSTGVPGSSEMPGGMSTPAAPAAPPAPPAPPMDTPPMDTPDPGSAPPSS